MAPGTWLFISGGKTAGPVSEATLRGLVDSGFLDAGSLVWTHGLEEWTPLGRVQGFESTAVDPAVGRDPESTNRFAVMALPGEQSRRATAALYLGWLSVLVFPAPLAVAASIGALHEFREVRLRTGREASGRAKAIFGLIAGSIGTLVLAWVVATAALT
jgi:hypothetical protein